MCQLVCQKIGHTVHVNYEFRYSTVRNSGLETLKHLMVILYHDRVDTLDKVKHQL